jgi:benzoate-CoA ligase
MYYNAAVDLIERNLFGERRNKIAVVDDFGQYTYAELADRVNRCANALRQFGLEPGQRLVLCLTDSIDFPVTFLGAIQAGIVPIPVNTLWTAHDYAYMLLDSSAKAAIVSEIRLSSFQEAARMADWRGRIIVSARKCPLDQPCLLRLLEGGCATSIPHPTRPNDTCFWLYSSGSSGKPKGAVHVHASLAKTAELFAEGVLGMNHGDIVYSAAKLFFAYGLGNALSFPFAVGATSILFADRPLPASINTILRQHRPTIFCGVPTLFSSLLGSGDLPANGQHAMRLCTSAGEALPEQVARKWKDHTGVDIIDGIGTTEMLHIFLSNRPGAVRYGTAGQPVPGYKVKLVNEDQEQVRAGEIGELHVSGPTSAVSYWNNLAKTRDTFLGEWTRTGDKLRQTAEGDFVYCGRADDMIKVGGIWVSPVEVEATLLEHDSVLEAAVVGVGEGLLKPKAFIVLRPGVVGTPELAQQLKGFVKTKLAPYKYPRWIEFVDELPKTATGKVQRYRLRQASSTSGISLQTNQSSQPR